MFRVLALLCILFVGFIGFVQANHIHSENSKLPSHECSICAVAHAGVLHQSSHQPLTLFARTPHFSIAQAASRRAGFSSSFRIRPPPAA